MHVYRISDFYVRPDSKDVPDVPTSYTGTFAECRRCCKATERGLRGAVFVELLEYPTAKEAAIGFLNGIELKVLASWRGTVRGGLQLAEDFRITPSIDPVSN